MRGKTLVLVMVLAVSLFVSIPYSARQGIATTPPPGSTLQLTVNPDRSIDLQATQYNSSISYGKNVDIIHDVTVSESYSLSGTVNDSMSTLTLYVGIQASVYWHAIYSDHFNHTVTVRGPNSNTIAATPIVYPNATSPALINAGKVRFNSTGTYTYQSAANNATKIPSAIGHIYVINGEENDPGTTNFRASLSKLSTEVLMNENSNRTLSAFQQGSLVFPFNDTDSLSATGTYMNGQDAGTLSIHAVSGVYFPLSDITLPYTINDTATVLTGSVGILFSQTYPIPFTNHTIFDTFLSMTFGNSSWVNTNIGMPLNSTTSGKITLFKFNVTAVYTDDTSALVSFKVVLKGDLMRFLVLGTSPPAKLSKLYNDTLTVFTRTDYAVTYTRSSGMIVATSTSHLVQNLDAQFNILKSEFLDYTNATKTPQGLFVNQTIFTISALNIQLTSTNTYALAQVTGIHALPPTVTVTGGFKEYGLFNYTGYVQPLNFTLIGGSNGTRVVTITLPAGAPAPISSSPSMVSWRNFQNFTKLRDTVFGFAIQTATAPTSLNATPGNATVTLNWSAPASIGGGAVTSYKIYRSTTSGTEVAVNTATSTTFTDNGLTNGQVYYYQVSAINAGGEGLLSAEVSASPIAPLIDIAESPFTLRTNSTVTNFSYNSTTGVATFQVEGNLGIGSLRITVPKTLVQSQDNVTITLDGSAVNPTFTQDANNYYFTFTYHYTTHTVKVTLALAAAQSATTAPFPWPYLAIALIIIILGGGAYFIRRRSKLKMPAAATQPTPMTK